MNLPFLTGMQYWGCMNRAMVARTWSTAGQHMAPVSVVLHQFPTPSLIYQGHAGHQHCRGLHRRPSLVHHGRTRSLHTSIPRALSWREFVLTVQLFGSGVKAMYNDMKLMKQYISQYGGLKIDKLAPTLISDGKTTLMYPRKELQFMYRVLD